MQIDTERFSWFQVPEEVKKLLILAAENWEDTSESEKYINLAVAKTADSTDVLVAAYRYFFYKNNYKMALKTTIQVINKIEKTEKLPNEWKHLKEILSSRKKDPKIRLYLNAYAAYGLVLAKLGNFEQAKEISAKVKEIDDKNEFGASIIHDILTRPNEEDE